MEMGLVGECGGGGDAVRVIRNIKKIRQCRGGEAGRVSHLVTVDDGDDRLGGLCMRTRVKGKRGPDLDISPLLTPFDLFGLVVHQSRTQSPVDPALQSRATLFVYGTTTKQVVTRV